MVVLVVRARAREEAEAELLLVSRCQFLLAGIFARASDRRVITVG